MNAYKVLFWLTVTLGILGAYPQGTFAGEFRVGGETFTKLEIQSKSGLAASETGATFNPSLGTKLQCKEGNFSGTLLQGGLIHAQALFSGCEVVGLKNCKIFATEADHESETNAGKISAIGLGQLDLHAGSHYLLFEGHPFTTFYYGGATCVLPLEESLSGSIALKLPSALEELAQQPLKLVNQEDEELLGVGLFYGTEPLQPTGGNTLGHLTTMELWGAE
jgi:hypothetical protein